MHRFGVLGSLVACLILAFFLLPRSEESLPEPAAVPSHLQGVTSDYFRYEFNNEYPAKYSGLPAEFERLETLKKAGAEINLVILYLADLKKTKIHIKELDQYIEYARKNNLYVALAPAGIGFRETNPNRVAIVNDTWWQTVEDGDLFAMWSLLAERYGQMPHTLFYLNAEPNVHYELWLELEMKLAALVREKSQNTIILSTPYYSKYRSLPILEGQVIYSTGGYVRERDGQRREREALEIIGSPELRQSYPVLVAEFGGNYNGDFGSETDLQSLKEILAEIKKEKLSFSVYRLSASSPSDGLALFDIHNNLTEKGEIFVDQF